MSSDSDLTPPPPSSQPTEAVISTKRSAGPSRRQSTRNSSSHSRSASSRSQSPVKIGDSGPGPRITLKMGTGSSDTPCGGDKRGTKRKSLAAEVEGEDAVETPAPSGTGRPTTYAKKRKSQADDAGDEAADSPASKLKLKFSASKATDSPSAGPDAGAGRRRKAAAREDDDDDTIVVENQEPARSTPGGKKGGSKRKAAGRSDAAADAIADLLEPSEETEEGAIHVREDGGQEPKKKGKAVKVKRPARARDPVTNDDADFEANSMADLFGESGDEADDAADGKADKDDDFVPGDATAPEPPQASGKKAKTGGKSAAATKKTSRKDSPEPEVPRKREAKPERRPAPTTARPAAPLGAGASAVAPVSSPATPAKPDVALAGGVKADDKPKATPTAAAGGPPKRPPVPLTGMMPKKKKPVVPAGAAAGATPTSSISLLQNTMAMIGKAPAVSTPTGKKPDPAAAKKDTPKPAKRVGQWYEAWAMRPDEQKEFDASAEERAAQRAIREAWRKTAVNLQASKDAYIIDSVRVRAIPTAGQAHSISTTGSVLEAVTTLHKMMGTNEDRVSAGPTLADHNGPWL